MPSMLSVPTFLSAHGISRSLFCRLVKEGRGKRLEITDAGKKALNGRDED